MQQWEPRDLTEEEVKALNIYFADITTERNINRMRAEIIRCDTCTKEHDARYVLPNEWAEIRKSDGFGSDESMHFCSKTCLIKWAIIGIAACDVEIIAKLGQEQKYRKHKPFCNEVIRDAEGNEIAIAKGI